MEKIHDFVAKWNVSHLCALLASLGLRLLLRYSEFYSDITQISGSNIGGWDLWIEEIVAIKANKKNYISISFQVLTEYVSGHYFFDTSIDLFFNLIFLPAFSCNFHVLLRILKENWWTKLATFCSRSNCLGYLGGCIIGRIYFTGASQLL